MILCRRPAWLLLAIAAWGCTATGNRRAALLERPAESGLERILLDDPAAVAQVESWMKDCYKAPPPPDQLGSVLPAAAVAFLHAEGVGVERCWAVYGDLDSRGRKKLIPPDQISALIEIFRSKGRPYGGQEQTGEYSPLNSSGAPPPEK
jgi:hypothetical protein